jgi:uncharacterized protein with FMN-binding domain
MSMNRKRYSRESDFARGIKKFLLSAFVVFSFLAYFLHEQRTTSASAQTAGTGPSTGNSPASSNTGNNNPNTLVVNSSPSASFKNGTYTGQVVNAYYGLVQVQVVISNGKISDVKFLQYPNDRRTSQRINTTVMPWLTQEAIQAQSANVNLISGATLTSEGFVNSLQSALVSAKN